MNSKTRILVIHSKELLIGIAIVLMLITLIITLIISIGNPERNSAPTTSTYTPGTYSASITFNGNPVEVEVCVDENHIRSISLSNTNEYITTMYPLLDNILDNLSTQICENNSTQNLTINENSRYTSNLLIEAINNALDKAYN